MSDVTSDYLALRREAGAIRLPRDVVRVSGPDAVTYLQGQLSQDVAALAPGESTRSLLLEPTGKVDAWIRVWGGESDGESKEVLIDVESGHGQAVVDRLMRFRLRVKAEIELLDWQLVAVRGPSTPPVETLRGSAELAAAVDWSGLPGVDLIGPDVSIPEGIREVGPEAFETVRIEVGWPAMGPELGATVEPKVIPAEAGQWLVDASASFTKGCYVGQELVARVDSRGSNTPRKLRGVVVGVDGDGVPVIPPVGAQLVVDGESRGELTSVAESLDLRAPVALAYVHRSVEPGTVVTLRWTAPDGSEATTNAQVRELPLVRG